MNVQCAHFDAGSCKLNLYGGRPSAGVCMLVCASYAGPERTPELIELTIGAQQTAGGCGCGQVPIVHALGMEHHGVPWFKRLSLRSPIYFRSFPGCGCLVRCKEWCIEVSSTKQSFDPNAKFFRAMTCAVLGV